MKRSLLRCIFLTQLLLFSIFSSPPLLAKKSNRSDDFSLKQTIVQAWQSIPAEVKEFGLVIVSCTICAYLTAKIFHAILKDSNEIAWQVYQPGQIKETFDHVAGTQQAKTALQDIVHFLKNPERFNTLGAQLPHGILLTGSPGNGKTLLARAMAGEVQCNFISVNGSDFVEMYAGVGAARIKQLFTLARAMAPCLLFIDEIDALGRARGSVNGSQEHDHALNQLLKELDGFESKDSKQVIVLAATNHESMLDPALIRPGRFDRIIHIPTPDQTTREAILQIHLRHIKTNYIDVGLLAMQTPGFSGAELANLVNQAAILAVHKKLRMVSMTEFEETLDLLILGAPICTMTLSKHEKLTTAYHEAGHALMYILMPHATSSLVKITITPRDKSLGLTYALPTQELHCFTKEEILAKICISLAGQAAEELIFQELSTGAHSDFQMATQMARSLICTYGMTHALGKRVIDQEQCSPAMMEKIDQAIFEILNEQYAQALQLLTKHKDQLAKIALALLEKETLNAGEIYALYHG